MSKPVPKPWPRLSETLMFPRHPDHCQSCGATTAEECNRWQEHDDMDRREPIIVVLCTACSNRLISKHPRLYRQLEKWEPWPGAMPICVDCTLRANLRCTHPAAKANGGPGIGLTMPQPTTAFVCRRGPGARGGATVIYHGPVRACAGRTVLPAENGMQI